MATDTSEIIDLTDIIEQGNVIPSNDLFDQSSVEQVDSLSDPSLDDLLGSLDNLREKSVDLNFNNELDSNFSQKEEAMPKKATQALEDINTDILFDEFDAIFNDALEKSPIKIDKAEKVKELDEDNIKTILEQSLPDDEEEKDKGKINSYGELDDLLDSIMKEDGSEEFDLMDEFEKANPPSQVASKIQSKSPQDIAVEELDNLFERLDSPLKVNNEVNSTSEFEDFEASLEASSDAEPEIKNSKTKAPAIKNPESKDPESKELEDNFEKNTDENKLEEDIEVVNDFDEEINFADLDKLLSSLDLPEQPSLVPEPEALKVLEDLEDLEDTKATIDTNDILEFTDIELIHEDQQVINPSEQNVELQEIFVQTDTIAEAGADTTLESLPDFSAEKLAAILVALPAEEANNELVKDTRIDELQIDLATQKNILELMEQKLLDLANNFSDSQEAPDLSEFEAKFMAKLETYAQENQSLKTLLEQSQEDVNKLLAQTSKLELAVEDLQTQNSELQTQNSELQADLIKLNIVQESFLVNLDQSVSSTAAKIIQEEIAALLKEDNID